MLTIPRRWLALLAPALATCACDASLPFSVDAPERELDLDAERARLEAELCAAPTGADCAVLRAVDESDGEASTPPALPAVLPREVRAPPEVGEGAPHVIDVEQWLADKMIEHQLVPALSFPLDGDAAALRDAVERASLDEVAFVYQGNTLNLDLPPLEVWVGDVGDGEVQEAIDDGALERIAVTDGLPASTDVEGTLTFTDGGCQRLIEALRDGETLAVRIDPRVPLALARGADAGSMERPGGRVAVALRLSGSIAIPIEELVALAR